MVPAIESGFTETVDELDHRHQTFELRIRAPVRRNLGEIGSIFPCDAFVEDFAEAVEVGLRGAGAFGWNVAVGADEGAGGVGAGDEADISEFGAAVYENDVRGFDVAVDEIVGVEMVEGSGEGLGDLEAVREGEGAVGFQVLF